MNKNNVTAGKPLISGAVHVAPIGTTLPTTAAATLDTAFKDLGYLSDAGVQNDISRESTDIVAWGGTKVLNIQTSKNDIWTYTMIEAKNIEVLKQIYGDDNVTENSTTHEITVTANATELEPHSWVFDMIQSDGSAKRIVIPDGKVTNVGTISYTDGDAVGYETTLTANPDEAGNTHYEYIAAAA